MFSFNLLNIGKEIRAAVVLIASGAQAEGCPFKSSSFCG